MKKLLLILSLVLLVAACSPHRGYCGSGYSGEHCNYWNNGHGGNAQYREAGYPARMNNSVSSYGY